MDRRHFLARVGKMAAATGVAMAATTEAADPSAAAFLLPTIALGDHQVTRLVAGSNPLNGYSYLGPHTDRHMREYYTMDRCVQFLLDCERAGINAHQVSARGADKAEDLIRVARDRGCQMHFIALADEPQRIKEMARSMRPIAIVHHGGTTDRLFFEGKSGRVRDYVKAVRDEGVLAGVSAHNPDCVKKIADEGWEVDLFMTCFYYLTRYSFGKDHGSHLETLELSYRFYRNDPEQMTGVIRQVKQPCLGFKILAAGRQCGSQETVRAAFRYAFDRIKPTDGVIVGMYPKFFDEIAANAQYARECGTVERS
jgi:hypothetical protein